MVENVVTVIMHFPLITNDIKAFALPYRADETLADFCQEALEKGLDDAGSCRHRISFSRYYQDADLPNFFRWLPYLKRGDKLYWNVPFDEVRVIDFLSMFSSGRPEIHMDIDNVGGAFDALATVILQSWENIVPILNLLGYMVTVKEAVEFVRGLPGRNTSEKPPFENFVEYIYLKDSWDLEELSKQLGTTDKLLVDILEAIGYEEHEGRYWKNAWKVKKYNEARRR